MDPFIPDVMDLPEIPTISSVVFLRVVIFAGQISYKIPESAGRLVRPDRRIIPFSDCWETDTIETVLVIPLPVSPDPVYGRVTFE